MKAILHGMLARPAVAVVGNWEPFTRDSRKLLAGLQCYAHANSLAALAVLLDPPIPLLTWGPYFWREYNDTRTRIELLRGSGADAVLQVAFRERDINYRARTFLKTIENCVKLAELWLGARQNFGRGREGSFLAIQDVADESGFRLTRLPEVRTLTEIRELAESVQTLLASGSVAKAAALVGMPPIKSRPNCSRLYLNWATGRYLAIPLEHPDLENAGTPFELRLMRSDSEMPSIRWPSDDVRYLAFTDGPNARLPDCPDAGTSVERPEASEGHVGPHPHQRRRRRVFGMA